MQEYKSKKGENMRNNIDNQIDYFYNHMLKDEVYSTFIQNRDKNQVRTNIKIFINKGKDEISQIINDVFELTQYLSNNLLKSIDQSNKRNEVDDIISTIHLAKNNFLSKVKSIFSGEDIDLLHKTRLKEVFSNLVYEKNKNYIFKIKMEKLLDQCFILEFMFDYYEKKQTDKEDEDLSEIKNLLNSSKYSLISNLSQISLLLDENKGRIRNLLNFIQQVSPKLFNELMYNYLGLANKLDSLNLPKNVLIKLNSINIIKENLNIKIQEFYNMSNIKKLNKILNDKKDLSKNEIRTEIKNVRNDMEVFLYTINKLHQQVLKNIEDVENETMELQGEEKDIIDTLINEAKAMSENLDEIRDELYHKIHFVYITE